MANKEMAMATDAYVKECGFYEHFQKLVPLYTPKLYFVAKDKEKPDEQFIIVMENLTEDWVALNQTVGISFEDMVGIANETADFHAQFFEPPDEVATTAWLNNGGVPWYRSWIDQFATEAGETGWNKKRFSLDGSANCGFFVFLFF